MIRNEKDRAVYYLNMAIDIDAKKIVPKLKEEELNELKKVEVEVDAVSLEDLIVLGENKKILIHITYPNGDGSVSHAKAYVKQLTLKEIDKLKLTSKNLRETNRAILRTAMFKKDGETRFTNEELDYLPLGVVDAVGKKIMELSGVEFDQAALINF